MKRVPPRPASPGRPLLPSEPRIANAALERELTERFLLPALPSLQACLLVLRHEVDAVLARRQPVKLGKPYPLGPCLEISLAVQERVQKVEPAALPPEARDGLRSLRQFQQAGGSFRRVWGDLRGQYFQNAFQLGSLYADVSNDTVVPHKPKVEIRPFDRADLRPIRDYGHFSDLAQRYWRERILPNHLLPSLAPYCPMLLITPDGQLRLGDPGAYMVSLTLAGAFAPSESFLASMAMPADAFDTLRAQLQAAGVEAAETPSAPDRGRLQAVQHCRSLRASRRHQHGPSSQLAIQKVLEINRRLRLADQPA